MHINRLVERFIRETQMSPTKFGKLAAGDPRLVFDMRNGREIGERVASRLRDFIADYKMQESLQEGIAA